MADRFRTGDEPLTGLVSLRIVMPSALWFRQEFLDLLHDMTEEFNWEKVGDVTTEEATQSAISTYWSVGAMVGEIISYITGSAPDNALPCDGAQYNRTDYPELYAAIDTAFIIDVNTFFVPDLRGRSIVGAGQGSGLTLRVTGDTGGEELHTLSVDELPSHSHSDSGHYHSVHGHGAGVALTPGELPVALPAVPSTDTTSSGNAAISNTGGDDGHENMPPFLVVKYAVIAW